MEPSRIDRPVSAHVRGSTAGQAHVARAQAGLNLSPFAAHIGPNIMIHASFHTVQASKRRGLPSFTSTVLISWAIQHIKMQPILILRQASISKLFWTYTAVFLTGFHALIEDQMAKKSRGSSTVIGSHS